MDRNSFFPGKGLAAGRYEYLLVTVPSPPVLELIQEEREAFCRQYDKPSRNNSRPYLTVATFLAHDEMEDTLIRWLQRIVGELQSFPVLLRDYNGIPQHSIYWRIQDDGGFRELAEHLQPIDFYIKSNDCPEVRFNLFPTLTVARNLDSNIYERAMVDYSERKFNASFELNELLMLRREHEHELCKEVAKFRLQPAASLVKIK